MNIAVCQHLHYTSRAQIMQSVLNKGFCQNFVVHVCKFNDGGESIDQSFYIGHRGAENIQPSYLIITSHMGRQISKLYYFTSCDLLKLNSERIHQNKFRLVRIFVFG